MSNLPKAVGAHIYAGGFTQGMQENLECLAHLETSDFGVKTSELTLKVKSLIDPQAVWSLLGKPEVQVVYGNPPCVAFSQLGHRGYLEHPSIQDVRSLLQLGVRLKPDVWVWECVGQAFTKGGALVDEVRKTWNDLGYHCTVFLTDAWLHGAAQRRQRFHFVAHRVKLDFREPAPIEHGSTSAVALSQVKPEVDPKNLQVRRYLQWLEPYSLPGLPLRRVWFWLHGLDHSKPKPEGLRFCPPFCLQRLDPNKPSVTLTGGPDFVHPSEWRVLSPGEMAWLSGYPQEWKWVGSVIDRYKQVAKGVTPTMGRYLGQVFRQGIEHGQGVEQAGFEVIDFRPKANELWALVKPPRLPQDWWGIAQDNRVKEGSHAGADRGS